MMYKDDPITKGSWPLRSEKYLKSKEYGSYFEVLMELPRSVKIGTTPYYCPTCSFYNPTTYRMSILYSFNREIRQQEGQGKDFYWTDIIKCPICHAIFRNECWLFNAEVGA